MPPVAAVASAIGTSILTILQLMGMGQSNQGAPMEAPRPDINGSGGYTGSGPIWIYNNNVNNAQPPAGTSTPFSARHFGFGPDPTDICQAVLHDDYVSSALRPDVVAIISEDLRMFTPDETRGILQMVVERLEEIGENSQHPRRRFSMPRMPIPSRHGRVRRSSNRPLEPADRPQSPTSTVDGLPYTFLEDEHVKPATKHVIAAKLRYAILPLEPVRILNTINKILFHALTEGVDQEADCAFTLSHYPCEAIPHNVLQICKEYPAYSCRPRKFLGARELVVGENTIFEFLKRDLKSFIGHLMSSRKLPFDPDQEELPVYLRHVLTSNEEHGADLSARERRSPKGIGKSGARRRSRPSVRPGWRPHRMRTPSVSSSTSGSYSSPGSVAGPSAMELAKMATVNVRRGLLGRRAASPVSNGGAPAVKRPRLTGSPGPGTSRGAGQPSQSPRASSSQAQDGASLPGSAPDGPVVRARSNTYPGANPPSAPTPEARPNILRRGWNSISAFGDKQGDRLIGFGERHPVVSSVAKGVGGAAAGVGIFLGSHKLHEAIAGGSEDRTYIKELERQTAELADLNSQAKGSLKSMKDVLVRAVKTGDVPEALVKDQLPSPTGAGPLPGTELAILIKHFGEQIRDPEWRPDPRLMKRAPDLYRLALLAPYYVGLEKASEKRDDETPTPLSPATVSDDSDSWLDTAPPSANNDPVASRLQAPNPVADHNPADEGLDRKPLIFMCVVGLLIGGGLILYFCSKIKRPGPRSPQPAPSNMEMHPSNEK